MGYSPWGRWESDTTERLHFHFSLLCIGEGNGNPLQCSCFENPRDRGAWWAAIYGVTQSRTRMKRLSSSIVTYLMLSRQQLYCNVLELLMLGFAKRRLMTQKRPWCCTMKTFIFSSESTQKVILLTQRSLKCSLVGWLQQRNRWTMDELMRPGWHGGLQLGGTSNTSPRTVISSLEHTWRR